MRVFTFSLIFTVLVIFAFRSCLNPSDFKLDAGIDFYPEKTKEPYTWTVNLDAGGQYGIRLGGVTSGLRKAYILTGVDVPESVTVGIAEAIGSEGFDLVFVDGKDFGVYQDGSVQKLIEAVRRAEAKALASSFATSN